MYIYTIHGNGQTAAIFKNIAVNFPIKHITLPGHDNTADLENYSLQNYAHYVNQEISSPAIVLAHSLGGHIALQVVKNNPLVKGLISIGAPPLNNENLGNAFLPEESIGVVYAKNPAIDMVKKFCELQAASPAAHMYLLEMFHKQTPKARTSFYESLAQGVEDEIAIINSLNIPSLFIYGAQEKLINLNYTRSLNLKNYLEIPNAGHSIMQDQPDRLNQVIEDFLTKF